MIEYSMQQPNTKPSNSAAEAIDDSQFHQLGAHLLQSIELALEAADDRLDLDLDVSRQGAMDLLRPLLENGLVEKIGNKKTGRYVLRGG